jgi:DNA-directed RNA polymerase I subunit RPA2
LVESMAGKAGACHGMFQDATPFQFNERQRAVDYFGDQLRTAGYNYYGTETMYSGVTGEPLHADIYLGVVYYQRLRHMVKDKSQVRATGPINNLTRQPVKGRKKHGGIRFGEMERDSLLAHGASFLLHDRLMNSSDRHIALVCGKCGSIVAPISRPAAATLVRLEEGGATSEGAENPSSALVPGAAASSSLNIGMGGDENRVQRSRRQPFCLSCGTGDHCAAVAVPYVFRYLANELAGMNIKIVLELGEGPYSDGPAAAGVSAQ